MYIYIFIDIDLYVDICMVCFKHVSFQCSTFGASTIGLLVLVMTWSSDVQHRKDLQTLAPEAHQLVRGMVMDLEAVNDMLRDQKKSGELVGGLVGW